MLLILGELLRFLDPPNREVERRWTGCYAMRRSGEPIFRAEPRPVPDARAAAPETEAESTGLLTWLSKRFFDRPAPDTGEDPRG